MATGHSRPGSNPTAVKTFRFGTLAISFTFTCQCLSEETVKAVDPFYLLSMPGEVKYPGHQSARECVTVVDSTTHSKPPPEVRRLFRSTPAHSGYYNIGRSASVCSWRTAKTPSLSTDYDPSTRTRRIITNRLPTSSRQGKAT